MRKLLTSGSRRFFLGMLLFALIGCERHSSSEAAPISDNKPNILLLYVDDLGYNDIGANNPSQVLPTHNIDALAAQGFRFTRHYADSTCAPARAAMLTGRYPARLGYDPDGVGLSPQVQTLPKELKRLGYTTHHVGKWHLGHRHLQAWPDGAGFDSWFGFLSQWLLSQSTQYPYWEKMFDQPSYIDPWLNDESHQPKQYRGHLSDILADRTVELIARLGSQKQPWFINHWFYQPHMPLQPAEQFAAKYPSTPEGRYLAVLEQLDTNIGRMLTALEQTNQLDNTLIVLASDNGGTNKQRDNNWPFYGKKAQYFEGGVRTPLIFRWPASLPQGQTANEIVSVMDIMPTLISAAGGVPSQSVDGEDLSELMKSGQALSKRDLFWEFRYQDNYVFSVLSADGRWRALSHLIGGPPNTGSHPAEARLLLNDLAHDSRGEADVVAQHPQQALTMLSRYVDWFRQVHFVALEFDGMGGQGRGRLKGDDFQRSPGNGAFTFAISIHNLQSDIALADPVPLVEQQGVWRMDYYPQFKKLRVELGGYEFWAPFTPSGQCQSLIFSGVFESRLTNWPAAQSQFSARILVDGKIAAQLSDAQALTFGNAMSAPTYVGRSPDGERVFPGRLGAARVYNAVVSDKNYLSPGYLQTQLCGVEKKGL